MRTSTHSVVLDDEVLIWDAAGVQLHRLNSSAARVWMELARWRSASEVAVALAGVVAVDGERLRADVAACIEELVGAGLVDRGASDEASDQ
jgi:hypothetical protein